MFFLFRFTCSSFLFIDWFISINDTYSKGEMFVLDSPIPACLFERVQTPKVFVKVQTLKVSNIRYDI